MVMHLVAATKTVGFLDPGPTTADHRSGIQQDSNLVLFGLDKMLFNTSLFNHLVSPLAGLAGHHGDGHWLAAAVLPHAALPASGTAAGFLQEAGLCSAAGHAAAHLRWETYEEGSES